MTQFDILLRQGLMDANLEQYGRVLQSADSSEPDFSPRYLRERMRLLAAPQDWEVRRTRPAPRRRRIPRGVAAAIAVLLLITAAAAVTVSLWVSYFGGLNQRQQEIIGDMEIGGEETEKPGPEKTAAESLLPPPVEHDGVTITPLRILGAKSQLYLVLEIRAPEGTVFHPGDDLSLFGSLRPSEQWKAEHPKEYATNSYSFTILEAGTKEPNVLVGVEEVMASYDVGGSIFRVWGLERRTADGENELVFGSWSAERGPTDYWEIPIPEALNEDQVLELQVEGMSTTDGGKTMTLLSMNVTPLGIYWKYRLEGEDPWPQARLALRMKDGSELKADSAQMTAGDYTGSGCTASVDFEKPVDLSQAEAVLWEDVVIPLEMGPET